MIRTEIIGDAVVAARLRAVSPAVDAAVRASIGGLVLRLQAKVRRDKLSGQVLNVRTGTLRRSIDEKVLATSGAVVGVVSTNVKYARAHEYGFKGSVSVKAHLRMVKQAFGKAIKNPRQIEVRAHSMKMNIPERSFLRSALKDMRAAIDADLSKAVASAVRR